MGSLRIVCPEIQQAIRARTSNHIGSCHSDLFISVVVTQGPEKIRPDLYKNEPDFVFIFSTN
jgi:hypothetical protein